MGYIIQFAFALMGRFHPKFHWLPNPYTRSIFFSMTLGVGFLIFVLGLQNLYVKRMETLIFATIPPVVLKYYGGVGYTAWMDDPMFLMSDACERTC